MNFVLLWSLVLCSEVPEETGSNSFLKDQPSAVRTSCWAVRRSVIFILQGSAGSKAPEASNGRRQTRIIQTRSQSKTDSLGNLKNSTCSSLWPLTPGSLQPDVTTGRLDAFKGLTSSVTWQQQQKNANTLTWICSQMHSLSCRTNGRSLWSHINPLSSVQIIIQNIFLIINDNVRKKDIWRYMSTHTHIHTHRERSSEQVKDRVLTAVKEVWWSDTNEPLGGALH